MWMVHVVDIIYSGHGRAEQLPEKLRPGKGKYYDSYFTVKIAGGSYSGCTGRNIKKVSDLSKIVNVISFIPSDVNLLKDTPKKRRDFFLEDCTPIPGCTEKAGFEICLCG